jgi:hypothetical protein
MWKRTFLPVSSSAHKYKARTTGTNSKNNIFFIYSGISRFQITRFRYLVPTAEYTPAEITPEFWTLISSL